MDIDVTQNPNGTDWLLTDLLGRDMGYVEDSGAGQFTVHPAGHALKTMENMRRGPFNSLDEALAEIEHFTRGTCRRLCADERSGRSD